MKFGEEHPQLDSIDLQILMQLQLHGRIPVVKLAEQVGLSSPAVVERLRKLEETGVIVGYHAELDARRLGKDVSAFIGVEIADAKMVEPFAERVVRLRDVLECHHVTGHHTMLLKVKTDNTATLESLIKKIRSIPGVTRTETTVVLSTSSERSWIDLFPEDRDEPSSRNRSRANGAKHPARPYNG